MRPIIAAMAAVGLAGAVLFLRADAMSTHAGAPPGSRTEVVVEASTKNAEESATERELTSALVLTCRLQVDAELTTSGVRELGAARYHFTLGPALDNSDRRQLHGCLEDTRIDHLQLVVERLENVYRQGQP